MSFGSLTLNFNMREVRLHDKIVKLTPIEYKLLTYMIGHPGQVLTHRMLLTAVWGSEYTERLQYVRVYMAQLRKKLDKASNGERLFKLNQELVIGLLEGANPRGTGMPVIISTSFHSAQAHCVS